MNGVVWHVAVPFLQLVSHVPVQRIPSDHKMIEHNVILPSNYSKLAHLTQLCMLNSERRETFPKLFFNQMISFNAHILCNDVASKCVIVEFLAGVWRVARGLHLASDHDVPRKQTHLRKEWNIESKISRSKPPQPSCQFHCPPHQSGQTWVRKCCVYKKWHGLGFTSVGHWHCSWRRHTYPPKPPPRCWRHPMKRSPTCLLFSSLKHHPATGTDT